MGCTKTRQGSAFGPRPQFSDPCPMVVFLYVSERHSQGKCRSWRVWCFFLAVLDLRHCLQTTFWLWCTGFSLRGLSCCGVLALGCTGFSSCGTLAWLPHGMWDLPGPEIDPMSRALAGRFLTTEPPGMPNEVSTKAPKQWDSESFWVGEHMEI